MNFDNLTLGVLLRIFTVSLIVVFFCQIGFAANHSLNTLEGRQVQISSNSIRVEEGGLRKERSFIFKGDVQYHYRNKGVTLYGDKMILRFKMESRLKYFQMLGNVRMEKGKVYVTSQEAYSENLNTYVDFYGNVTFSTSGSSIKVDKIRYNFITETFSVPEYGINSVASNRTGEKSKLRSKESGERVQALSRKVA